MLSFHHIAVCMYVCPIDHILFLVVCTHSLTQPLSLLCEIPCQHILLPLHLLCVSKILFLISIVCSCCGLCIEICLLQLTGARCSVQFVGVLCYCGRLQFFCPFGNHNCVITGVCVCAFSWDRVVVCLCTLLMGCWQANGKF